MNKKISFSLMISFIMVLSLSACNSRNSNIDNNIDPSLCLDVEFPIGYPYKADLEGGTPTPYPPILDTWEPVLKNTLPEGFYLLYNNFTNGGDDALVIDPKGGMWLRGFKKIDTSIRPVVLRISEDFTQIQRYDVADEIEETVFFFGNYLSDDGTLYLFGTYQMDHDNYHLYISYYDKNLDKFQPVSSIDDLPVAVFYKSPYRAFYNSNVVADSRGVLWFTVNGSLLNFDPISNHLQIEEIDFTIPILSVGEETVLDSQSLLIDENGLLWMMVETQKLDKDNHFEFGRFFLVSYDPNKQSTLSHASPPGLGYILSKDDMHPKLFLFQDQENRIWVSDYGWYENQNGENVWFKLIRPDIFVSSQPTNVFQASDQQAYPKFVEKNRYIWFASDAGMARLDLKNQKWCLLNHFDTGTPLVKDQNGNIWIETGLQIYKFNQ